MIEENVKIGKGTRILEGSIIKRYTKIGDNCVIGPYAVIGGEPADFRFKGEVSYVVIGNNVTIREFATVHRATGEGEKTVIEDGVYIMPYAHISHNCLIKKNAVITNGAQLAGHVEIGEYAFIGGMAGIHQFTRIGKYAILGACSYASQDVCPYMLASGNPLRIYGVNMVGLKRHGFSQEEIEEAKKIYRIFFKTDLKLDEKIMKIEDMNSKIAKDFLKFVKETKRGIRVK